mmetsp:Transcript_4520/g.14821  ORF Transcript_4520/g.14821 Transcript_4520/m.14821 type:complete len:234 (-) Transcript_4520:265-966(-)
MPRPSSRWPSASMAARAAGTDSLTPGTRGGASASASSAHDPWRCKRLPHENNRQPPHRANVIRVSVTHGGVLPCSGGATPLARRARHRAPRRHSLRSAAYSLCVSSVSPPRRALIFIIFASSSSTSVSTPISVARAARGSSDRAARSSMGSQDCMNWTSSVTCAAEQVSEIGRSGFTSRSGTPASSIFASTDSVGVLKSSAISRGVKAAIPCESSLTHSRPSTGAYVAAIIPR